MSESGDGNRGRAGAENGNWRGGRHVGRYVRVRAKNHPRALPNGYVYEHVLMAEHALGKPMPPGAEVHHVNEDKTDNSRGNLVVCENRNHNRRG